VEIEKMKKDIESLKSALKSNINYEYNQTSLLKYDLADKERMILEYIRNNPGCNKQSVVEHFNNMDIPGLSRNPIFNIIKSLIERGYVIEERDRHTKNTRNLFLNEQHVILSVTEEIEDFRNRFLELLKNPNLVNIQNNNDKKNILKYIDRFYSTFISIYVFRALPAFRKMINDKQTLHELYNTIFSNVYLLQEQYYEFDNPMQMSYFLDAPLSITICTDDVDYDRKFKLFKNYGMEDQIKPLLERLDGINYRYAKQNRILG
jgi:DNA-binding MarR family transcriptional regulator